MVLDFWVKFQMPHPFLLLDSENGQLHNFAYGLQGDNTFLFVRLIGADLPVLIIPHNNLFATCI